MLDSEPDPAPFKTRSLLVLRHEPSGPLGSFEGFLKSRSIRFVYSDLRSELELGRHDAIVVMGGQQSANDPELAGEVRFIQQAMDSSIPVLGICLGAQVIAKALRAHVYCNPEKEIGWA